MRNVYASKLLARKRVGALVRVFSHAPDVVEYQCESALRALEKLLGLTIEQKPIFSRIDFLVSHDARFEDTDCGYTADYLREQIRRRFQDVPVYVHDVRTGDIYCMLLDYGIIHQSQDRVEYSMIASHGVSDYFTQENIEAMLAALYCKARVAGLAIDELDEYVLEGRIQNTCAFWHNKSLMTVGGFDLRAAKPERARVTIEHKVHASAGAFHEEYGHKDIYYTRAGCEEIIPLLRFIRLFGPSIAAIRPHTPYTWHTGQGGHDLAARKRHIAKLLTKAERQAHVAALEGSSLDILKSGLVTLDNAICNPEPHVI